MKFILEVDLDTDGLQHSSRLKQLLKVGMKHMDKALPDGVNIRPLLALEKIERDKGYMIVFEGRAADGVEGQMSMRCVLVDKPFDQTMYTEMKDAEVVFDEVGKAE